MNTRYIHVIRVTNKFSQIYRYWCSLQVFQAPISSTTDYMIIYWAIQLCYTSWQELYSFHTMTALPFSYQTHIQHATQQQSRKILRFCRIIPHVWAHSHVHHTTLHGCSTATGSAWAKARTGPVSYCMWCCCSQSLSRQQPVWANRMVDLWSSSVKKWRDKNICLHVYYDQGDWYSNEKAMGR